jgi:hypothetical protein
MRHASGGWGATAGLLDTQRQGSKALVVAENFPESTKTGLATDTFTRGVSALGQRKRLLCFLNAMKETLLTQANFS